MFYSAYLIYKVLELKLNEKRSEETILKIREKKLRKLLKHVYKNSKFYREYYENVGIKYEDLDDISIDKLPKTDKIIINENFDKVITDSEVKRKDVIEYINSSNTELFQNKYHVIHSSGSSGHMGITLYNEKEMAQAFSCTPRMQKFKLHKEKTKLAYYAAIGGGRFGGVSLVKQAIKGIMDRIYKIYVIDINDPIEQTIKELNKIQPQILISYATGLIILAKFQREGKLKINPEVVENGGEGLSDKDYKFVRDTFNVPIVNMYAASECYYLGIGKEEYNGIYLMDDFNYIEVMEDHILVTNLYNYTLPLIRYRIDDVLKIKKDDAKLLPFRLAENVIGRNEDTLCLVNSEGNKEYLHPILFHLCVEGLDKLQIVRKKQDEIEVLIVPEMGMNLKQLCENVSEKISEILEKKMLNNVKFKVEVVDIPKIDKMTRKFKMIFDETREGKNVKI